MADTKKYYWLKLKKDFFKKHEIRIVESMPNGKDYILFYLKLLVESINHEGHLRFSDTIPYNEEMLSSITNTNIDIVRAAMAIFKELQMIEVLDDSTIFMTEVSEMIGSETEWAGKKREYRHRIMAQEQGQLGDKKGQCPIRDKSIEIRDKSIDNNISSLRSDILSGKPDDAKEIIEYLNKKTGKNFKHNAKATQRNINGRLSDGYTIDDFKRVIDVKCDEWLGDKKMEQYLRPETLFSPSHFESYLNQNPATTEQVNIDYSEFLRSGDE